MKIFVTGATGVIGRRVVPELIRRGHEVTAIGRSPEARRALEASGALAVSVSLFDRGDLRRAVEGHDTIINLATHMPASAGRMFLPGAWRENDRIRRDGSANLVEAALATAATRFVQESFAPIYEPAGDRWLDESCPQRPAPYNRSLLDAEASAERFTSEGGVGVVLRFGAFYGPDEFGRVFVNMTRKGWAPIPGPREGFFSSIAHDDAAMAVIAALGARAGTYNATDDEPLRRREYAEALCELLGVRAVKYTPTWLARIGGSIGEVLSRSQRISNVRLKEETGWAPRYRSAREGWRVYLPELLRAERSVKPPSMFAQRL
jgi:nucleoside-diphosphate-sugar epimerase